MSMPVKSNRWQRLMWLTMAAVWTVLLLIHGTHLVQGAPNEYPGQHVKGMALTGACLAMALANVVGGRARSVFMAIGTAGIVAAFVLMLVSAT